MELEYSTQFGRWYERAVQLKDMPTESAVVTLGIVGNPGVGKSTLIKVLFNKLSHTYEASCILLDVRERAKSPRGLEKLLTKLCKDLAKVDIDIDDVDQGRALLKERLACPRCLLILDDVGLEKTQLESLLIAKERLGSGSLVIVTSRYNQVLTWAQIKPHRVIELTDDKETRDVVVSYHGRDVIKEFVDHLRESFVTRGLTVSVDSNDHEPEAGEGLSVHQVLTKTKHFVVVLSNAYVHSPICLDKLSGISKTDAKIVPVFYRLKHAPEIEWVTVREWTGKGYPIEKVEMWNNTLQNVRTIDLRFCIDLDDSPRSGKKVKDIVVDVVNLFEHKTARDVVDYPVGLVARTQDLEKLLNIKESEPKTIAVRGMGGAGKTTLVKALYNSLHKEFEGSCILLDVRARAGGDFGLQELQAELLNVILGESLKIGSVSEGKALLSRRLEGTNVLLILDDVDNRQQLDALLSQTKLGSKSRVVVTSRNHDVIHNGSVRINETYEVEGLAAEDAKTLFCWHAFLRPYAPPALNNVAQQLIDACQGLPLALEVFGSYVYDNDDIDFWEETLEKMRTSNNDIFKILRISFEQLQEDEQIAFRDVACFLLRKDEGTVLRFWKGCGMSAKNILQVLKRKSLVKVDSVERKIMMHDQLRDMGRYCVNEGHIERPWNRTHVWNPDDAKTILDRRNGTDIVRGLSWMSESAKAYDAVAFTGLCELRILFLSNLRLHGDLGGVSKEIRWLQWHKCELEHLPPELRLREITVLDLSESKNLKGLWNYANSDGETPRGLFELNLSGCETLQQLPQFDVYLKELERLDLSGCEKLDRIPDAIGSLQKLTFLSLSRCTQILDLPNTLAGLVSLTKLFLDGCKALQHLPENIGRLTKLTEISLEHTKLRTLPESFGNLESLEVLRLSECSKLAKLPSSIGKLRRLQIWSMSSCPILESLPEEVSKLIDLVELSLHHCSRLVKLPEQVGQLKRLRTLMLHHNPSLASLPPTIGELESLDTLELGDCILTNEGTPRSLGRLPSLKKLSLQYNKFRQVPAGLEDFAQLTDLQIHHCRRLREAKFFPGSLRTLDVGDCPCLEILSGLDLLNRLTKLVLCNCVQLEELNGLESLELLVHLNISGCSKLRSAPGLYALTSLQKLLLAGSRVVPTLDCVQRLERLQTVTIYGSHMPLCFKNCMEGEIDAVEYANREVITVRISRPCIAVLFCFVSHDQGWSDYPWSHGRFDESFTFVNVNVMRNGSTICTVEKLFTNRHADIRAQMHFCMLRASHQLVRVLQSEDDLKVRAFSLYQGWRISMSKASLVLVHEEEELEGHLRTIYHGI